MAERDVEVTTADGRRWVVDQHWLRLPDDMTPTEEARAAADKLLTTKGVVEVPADLLGAWLDRVVVEQGACCDLSSPCIEHERALAMARHVLGLETDRG